MTLSLEDDIALTPIGQFNGDSVQLGASSISLEALRMEHEGWMPKYMAGS